MGRGDGIAVGLQRGSRMSFGTGSQLIYCIGPAQSWADEVRLLSRRSQVASEGLDSRLAMRHRSCTLKQVRDAVGSVLFFPFVGFLSWPIGKSKGNNLVSLACRPSGWLGLRRNRCSTEKRPQCLTLVSHLSSARRPFQLFLLVPI